MSMNVENKETRFKMEVDLWVNGGRKGDTHFICFAVIKAGHQKVCLLTRNKLINVFTP